MPVKFCQTIDRFWFFLSYLITTVPKQVLQYSEEEVLEREYGTYVLQSLDPTLGVLKPVEVFRTVIYSELQSMYHALQKEHF